MGKWILFLAGTLLVTNLFGYWQQEVAYDMDVHLDTEAKRLTASSTLTYSNHSPDTLSFLLMHLFPNAFNPGSILDEQARETGWGRPDPDKPWTGIRIENAIDLTDAANTQLEHTIFDDTLLRIVLNQPLQPGQRLTFRLDWTSLIHEHFDRSGWEDEQFDMTQWYPKFVVYDKNGWRADPFGDWGEFYGEFGSFRVTLNVPEDYIVGATGEVIDGDPGWVNVWVDTTVNWVEWNQQNAATYHSYRTNLPEKARKSVTFQAEQVHDFAWVASPDLVYEHGEWNGLDVHVLYDRTAGSEWSGKEVKYGERALAWLSTRFGPYPYPQMTIVKSRGGGGMEYPMLIMDGYSSEGLVVHEIGHNWFYGILGNDEMNEAWLDEGFTTFQTRWYQETRYPNREDRFWNNTATDFEYQRLPWLSRLEEDRFLALTYMLSPRNEPILKRSQDFIHDESYRRNVYTKAGLMLSVLKDYLGEARFLQGMRLYYDRFALKHPSTPDFIKAMEDASGEDLDWFFEQWLLTPGYVDYALDGYKVKPLAAGGFETTVRVKRVGPYYMPVDVAVIGKRNQRETGTLDRFRYRSDGVVTIRSPFKPVNVVIDPDDIFMDANRLNNDARSKLDLRYRLHGWANYRPDAYTVEYAPLVGYTDASGTKLGLDFRGNYRGLMRKFDAQLWLSASDEPVDWRLHWPGKFNFSGGELTGLLEASFLEGITQAELSFKQRWSAVLWKEPIHALKLAVNYVYIDRVNTMLPVAGQYTQFLTRYDLTLRNANFYAQTAFGPAALCNRRVSFSQLEFSMTRTKNWSFMTLRSRFTGFATDGDAPVEQLPATSGAARIHQFNSDANRYLGLTSDLSEMAKHYRVPGGGNLRGWSAAPVYAPFMWAFNLQAERRLNHMPLPVDITTAIFADVGQFALQQPGTWNTLGDGGVSLLLRYQWIRTNWLTASLAPVHLRIDVPLGLYDWRDENVNWVPGDWSFSFNYAF
ncbi:MAG: M1 family metallopeptidase [Lentisphaeria bacterium]|nr:M1 family metallopeptidase [Candidatus Neomarinimicrobiota bacterium]MCF7841507.1 M1 family metallopeptidase [Lentisphaeria bacterium]